MSTVINSTNWNYCHFKSAKLKAQITFGADWIDNTCHELYFITVTDHDEVEVFQESYQDFKNAQEELHKRYGHWEFVDLSKAAKAEGCDSCAAH
ncbi:hypothetical protein M899_0701 [Bacteriovorax sp. BSW11_IV]|uniref:hypothetical protein n=1 Tax=Bacteriovorax sp. BSW11_IV TaxID=1353529 RepID=UPI00038A4731|nr:hypothetical protein [Bacteriovorax sp. BSW11_IV]EQC49117.1 hypothetical protein M899_0701 [Bacteriovorax sp. BSW11_IV]